MLHKNYIRATAFERLRIDAMRKAGCIMTMIRLELSEERAKKNLPPLAVPENGRIEIHHLVEGNKRLGHWWTIALHSWWHRGVPPRGMRASEARALYGAALTDGRKAFYASHGFDERDLWVEAQGRMGMSVQLPVSKVFPRRELQTQRITQTTENT